MKTNPYLTTTETAKALGVSPQRVRFMLKQDQTPRRRKTHFPGAYKTGRDWLIPAALLKIKKEAPCLTKNSTSPNT